MPACCGQQRACVSLVFYALGKLLFLVMMQLLIPQAHGDVRVDNISSPAYIEVQLKSSKTDPFRQGVAVYLGRTSQDLCPVAAVLAYMVTRGTGPGIFFRFQDGRSLTRERFVSAVKVALTNAGVDSSRYNGHSFRIGAATTAALRALPDSLIKTLGRWKSSAYTACVYSYSS